MTTTLENETVQRDEGRATSSALFIVPNLRSMYGDTGSIPGHPHTGVAYLSAFLKEHGVNVVVYDERIDGPENLRDFINRERFDLIGVTAFSYSLRNVYSVLNRIKEITDIPIVVGGPHVSVSKGDILEKTCAGFAVKHEGEHTTLELLNALTTPGSDFGAIDGLIWRRGSEVVENRNREMIEDLDDLPYPDYESFGIERYPCFESKTVPLITQRGCPYQCNFCSVPVSMGQLFRYRSPDGVIAEIQYWYDKGYRHLSINDDVFNIRRDRVIDICKLIKDRGLKITWELYNGIRVNVADEELLRAMKEAGCVLISYGCESGNPRILKVIKKGLTLEQVSRAVELTHKVGIRCSVNFIIGHPTETYEEAKESLSFAKSLPATFVNFYSDTPYPGTSLFEWVTKNATILFPDYLSDLSYRGGEPIYETPEFTKEQRKEILLKGYALYERSILRYRLGGMLGSLAFWLTRIPAVHWAGRQLVYNTRIGSRIFRWLSIKFGGMVWLDQSEGQKTGSQSADEAAERLAA